MFYDGITSESFQLINVYKKINLWCEKLDSLFANTGLQNAYSAVTSANLR